MSEYEFLTLVGQLSEAFLTAAVAALIASKNPLESAVMVAFNCCSIAKEVVLWVSVF